MVDVAPGLLEAVKNEFARLLVEGSARNKRIGALVEAMEAGEAAYKEANEYSALIGETLAEAFENTISADVLPDGKFYYNIAQKVLPDPLKENHTLVSAFNESVQNALNQKAGIGIAAKVPAFDISRVEGLIDFVSKADNYSDIETMFLQSIINLSQYYTDESVKDNADFQWQAGLRPKIIRTMESGATRYYTPRGSKKRYAYHVPCEWCQGLAGAYDYPLKTNDIYRRHRDCRCTVEYYPGDGRRQNSHTKKWFETETPEEMIASAKAMLGEE